MQGIRSRVPGSGAEYLGEQRSISMEMQVTVPAGVGPGTPFLVNTPSGQMQVTCPLNASAGSQMIVNVPMAQSPPADVPMGVPAMQMGQPMMAQPMMAQPMMAQPMMQNPYGMQQSVQVSVNVGASPVYHR